MQRRGETHLDFDILGGIKVEHRLRDAPLVGLVVIRRRRCRILVHLLQHLIAEVRVLSKVLKRIPITITITTPTNKNISNRITENIPSTHKLNRKRPELILLSHNPHILERKEELLVVYVLNEHLDLVVVHQSDGPEFGDLFEFFAAVGEDGFEVL